MTSDETEPRGEDRFYLAWRYYDDLTRFLRGNIDTYYQGSAEDREELGREASSRLTTLREVLLEYYGEPRIVFAVLDVRNFTPRRSVRVYLPTTDEVKEAHVLSLGRGYMLRDTREATGWENNPFAVERVARVLLYALPDDERAEIWLGSPSMDGRPHSKASDMYKDMYLAE